MSGESLTNFEGKIQLNDRLVYIGRSTEKTRREIKGHQTSKCSKFKFQVYHVFPSKGFLLDVHCPQGDAVS